ncbi:hypothetical protein GCM10009096_07560 [Parasphingorhabdus litoris]|uniref:Uncharacterized protein n=1 Tax=Parasphingorhabdus litoris TaxID=394733 RepID=A0ABN1A6Z2_9SPHN|nr:hypothetical protein [Parasphingorhabdus litoris]
MLTIAIASFFALAFAGALLTIAMMFHAYRDKIIAVIAAELGSDEGNAPAAAPRHSRRVVRTYPASARRRPVQPIPLRAAA